jgi:cytochrome c oxidase subunit 2
MYSGLPFVVPPTISTYDNLLNIYLLFGVGAGVVVTALLAIFMVRYRAKGKDGPPVEHKTEGWKIVLVTVLISITILSTAEYATFASFGNIEIPSQCSQVPSPCINIGVEAFQWGWNFNYTNGKVLLNNLTVPAGSIVILTIRSKDVFHSFSIEMLAVKEDAIPGKTNQLWFEVPSVQFASGNVKAVCNTSVSSCVYQDAIRCFELCGVGHAFMDANLNVTDAQTWNAFIGK